MKKELPDLMVHSAILSITNHLVSTHCVPCPAIGISIQLSNSGNN